MSDQRNSFGVDLPEPSDRMREAVRLHDENVSAKDAAASMDVTPGTYGNAKVEGLRRMGRADEVSAPTTGTRTGGTAMKPRGVTDVLEAELAKVDERVTSLNGRVKDATDAANAKPADVEKVLRTAFEKTVADAQAALDAFVADPKSAVEAETTRLAATRDKLTESTKEEIETLTKIRAEHENALTAVRAALGIATPDPTPAK